MKSGIKSIGLNVCATTKKTNALAYQGVRGSLAARYTAKASFLRRRARAFNRSSIPAPLYSPYTKRSFKDWWDRLLRIASAKTGATERIFNFGCLFSGGM